MTGSKDKDVEKKEEEVKKVDDGGYVYPLITPDIAELYDTGLNRRDWLAGNMAQGLLSDAANIKLITKTISNSKKTFNNGDVYDAIAAIAYEVADALIAKSRG